MLQQHKIIGCRAKYVAHGCFTYEDIFQVDDRLQVSDAKIFQLRQEEEARELEDPHHDENDFVGICFVASVSSRVDLVGVDEVQDEPVDSQIKLETELSKYSRF